jgi:hypothetical protein
LRRRTASRESTAERRRGCVVLGIWARRKQTRSGRESKDRGFELPDGEDLRSRGRLLLSGAMQVQEKMSDWEFAGITMKNKGILSAKRV